MKDGPEMVSQIPLGCRASDVRKEFLRGLPVCASRAHCNSGGAKDGRWNPRPQR